MKPILLTGATGFLGKHLVRFLLARGDGPLRLLSYGPSGFEDEPRLEILPGDITRAEDVERAVAGCGRIYHLAGFVSRNPNDAPLLHRIHVEGSRLLCEAALRHGVERVVYASTSGTIAVSRRPVALDETAPYPEALVARWAYYTSKIAAEKLVLDYHRRNGLPVVIVNPSLLLGPGDERASSTGDVLAMLERQVLSLPPGGVSFVDARDCAAGIAAAMDRGRVGERYLLSAVNWRVTEYARVIEELSGVRTPRLTSPTWLSLLAAPLLRRLMPLLGRKFEIDNTTIEMGGVFWFCDSSKARRELGFTPRDPRETLRDTIADLRARHGASA